jgi:hypothetical protein
MVSFPMLLIFGVLTWYVVKKGGAKPFHMAIALLLGLAMAGTSLGGQLLSGTESALTSAVNGVSGWTGSGAAPAAPPAHHAPAPKPAGGAG